MSENKGSTNKKVMLINVTHAEESRVAILHDGVLEAFEIETFDRRSLKGNFYKAKVESVHPGLQAAFVDIGGPKAAFLPLDEVNFSVHPVRGNNQKGRIENHLQKGQELLVQVVRDAYATKPPTVSTYFSLPGRHIVLTPFSETIGISRKLEDKQRDRIRKILESLPRPEEHGLIVRTAGAAATKLDLQRDLKYLVRLWERCEDASNKRRAPRLIYEERSLVIRAIRDLYTPDIDELLVDDRDTFEEILEFFETVAPHKKNVVKLYEGDRPVFNKWNLEEQIENIFRRRVNLPSGGAIVFDATEALTAVDVNSSRMKKEGHIEDTALKCNLEAAEEVARQLRLRDMGGLVVIDFIDMRANKNSRAVEKRMKDALKKDKARYDVTRISSLGLMEISRERLAAEKSSLRYTDCPMCNGTGSIKTVEAAAMQALRRLQTRVVRGDLERVELTVPSPIAEYLLNQKRAEIMGWEERYQTRIHVFGKRGMGPDDCEIETVVRERIRSAEPLVAPPSQDEVLAGIAEDEAREKAEAAEKAAQEEAAPKKKRRRRRRKKKTGDAEGASAEESAVMADEDDDAAAAGLSMAAAASLAAAGEDDDEEGFPEEEPQDESQEESQEVAQEEPKKKRRRRRRRRKPSQGETGGTEAEAGGESAHTETSDEAAPIEVESGPRPRALWWRELVETVNPPPAEAAEEGQEAPASVD